MAIAPSLISATEQAAEQLPAEQVLAEHPLFPSYSEVQLLNEQSFDSKVKNEAVSCVWFFFEAGIETIISERLGVWLHLLSPIMK